MRMGVHGERLPASLKTADRVLIFSPPGLEWNAREEFVLLGEKLVVCEAVEEIVQRVVDTVQAGDQVLIMSNGGFGGIHQRLLDALGNRYPP
jgi:UDP-N-acetylmuramate: L-alanyl-gamma-D-glutamyl-meso-diaminopimelate ligase